MDKLVHLLELCDAVFSQAALREWSLPTCSTCSGQAGTRCSTCSSAPPALDGRNPRKLFNPLHVVFWALCDVPCGVLGTGAPKAVTGGGPDGTLVELLCQT